MTEVKKKAPMAKDRAEKYLEGFNDVFADITNHLIFDAPMIQEEDLKPGPTESIYKAEDSEALKEQRRDVSKYVEKLHTTVSLIGLENQSQNDKDMSIRMMGYDYGSYRDQIVTGKERYGVISAVLYFGKDPWKSGCSLKQQLSIPKELVRYVSDYKFHLIDVPRLSKRKRAKLTSDFKVVADFFAEKDKANYKPSQQEIVHVEAVLHLLRTFTGDKRYQEIEGEIMSKVKEGRAVNMCDFAERMEQKGIKEGIKEGIQVGENNFALLSNKLIEDTRIDDLKKATTDIAFREQLYEEYGIRRNI